MHVSGEVDEVIGFSAHVAMETVRRADQVFGVAQSFVVPPGAINEVEDFVHGFLALHLEDCLDVAQGAEPRFIETRFAEEADFVFAAELRQRFGNGFVDRQSGAEGIARSQTLAVFVLFPESCGFFLWGQVAEDPAWDGRDAEGFCRHIAMLSVDDVEGSVVLQGYGQRGALGDVPVRRDSAVVVGDELALDGRVRFEEGEREVFVVGSADFGRVGHDREGKGAFVEGRGG